MRLMDAGALGKPALSRPPVRLAAVVLSRPAIWVGIVALAALAARLWQLDGKSLWFDEAYSVFIADQPLGQIPRLLRSFDTHPPLHYLILHFWMGVFGKSEIAVRLPSVLASVGAVTLTFLLGRRVAGERVGILAAVLLAFSPFQVTSAQEARMYPFLTLFAVGGAYALTLALEEGARRAWIAYAACLALAVSTHHFGALLVPAYGLAVLLGRWEDRGAVRRWLLWTGAALAAYLPLLPLTLAQLQTARGWPDIRPPFGLGALTDALGMFSFGGGLFGMGTYFRRGFLPLEQRAAVLLPFLLIVAVGVSALPGRGRRALLVSGWLLPVLLPAAVSLRWNIFYERYFSFVLPAFCILLAAGVFALADLAGQRRGIVAAALLLLIGSFTTPALADVYRNTHQLYDWRGAARHVSTNGRADDFLLYVPAFTRIPFEYYFQGPQERLGLNPREILTPSQLAALGKLRLRTGLEPAFVASIARRHPRMWIVSTIPLGYDARMRINTALTPSFREVEGRTFGQVYAFLWESRLDTGPAGR